MQPQGGSVMQNGTAGMEPVVAVAIGVLSAVAFVSLVVIMAVLVHKFCVQQGWFSRMFPGRENQNDMISQQYSSARPGVGLVDAMEGPSEVDIIDMELRDVQMNRSLQKVLEDSTWVNDATGLAPHCLAILKTCHTLTEKLVGMTMGRLSNARDSHKLMHELVTVAKRISRHVDAVVRAMYPPLDPRLLEARCSALVLLVSHLVVVTKSACHLSGVLDWVEHSLAEVENHLKILQVASLQFEAQMLQERQTSSAATLSLGSGEPNPSQPHPPASNHGNQGGANARPPAPPPRPEEGQSQV